MEISKERLLELYNSMLTIRLFEDRIVDLYARGLVPGLAHLYLGEEAIAAGACAVLRDDDYITSTHRGHGHVIAKGADLKLMMAELFGKKTGYCKGKGGSMHIADMQIGILGANGIAGGGLPIAVGAGLSIKLRKTDQVAVVFFGDGAANRGPFHEAANMAAIWKLPVIFVCENNLYASTTAATYALAGGSVAARAAAYGIPGLSVDGNDVLEVRKTVGEAVERAREGKGPSIVENRTYRYRGHFEGDPQRYRSQTEIEKFKNKTDPIQRFRALLKKEGVLSDRQEKAIRGEVTLQIEEAVSYAKSAPLPRPEEALEDLFVNP